MRAHAGIAAGHGRRLGLVLLMMVLVVPTAGCSNDEDEEPTPATSTTADVGEKNDVSSNCVDTWVGELNALDPAQVESGFDETSPLVANAQLACPFDEMSAAQQSEVFAKIDPDIRQALEEAGFIEFQPVGEPVY